jgi:hypothetical protein
MEQIEKNIEKFFTTTVRMMGGLCYKWTSPNQRGVPDRIAFLPYGLIIVAEIKKPDGKLSPLQEKVIRMLRERETEVVVIKSFEDVREFKKAVTEILEDIAERREKGLE